MLALTFGPYSNGLKSSLECCRQFCTLTGPAIESLVLRQQLVAMKYRHPRPRLTDADRVFWATHQQLDRVGEKPFKLTGPGSPMSMTASVALGTIRLQGSA